MLSLNKYKFKFIVLFFLFEIASFNFSLSCNIKLNSFRVSNKLYTKNVTVSISLLVKLSSNEFCTIKTTGRTNIDSC